MRMLGVRRLRYNGQVWQIQGRLTALEITEQVKRIREQDSIVVSPAWDNPELRGPV
jgi:hypothetical protein